MTTITDNLDGAQIEHFDQMAQDWWQKDGPCKPLHDLNPLRLAFIQNNCNFNNKTILDIGCGGGILTESLSQFCPSVTGADKSQELLKIATNHAKDLSSPPQYICATIEELADQGKEFDIITCMELIEHVPDPISLVQSLAKCLKPKGDLFISTLNRTPMAFMQAIVGAEYLLKMLPKGTHQYSKFLKPSELRRIALKYNLSLNSYTGIKYNPLTKEFKQSEDVSVNYILHFVKTS